MIKSYKRKGFSLVEMAVVLIIVGILVGMTISSTSLIDTTRFNREVSRISNMEIGIGTYFAMHETLPYAVYKSGSNTKRTINLKKLIDDGHINAKDLEPSFKAMGKHAYKFLMENAVNSLGDPNDIYRADTLAILYYIPEHVDEIIADESKAADFASKGPASITVYRYCRIKKIIDGDKFGFESGAARIYAYNPTDYNSYLTKCNPDDEIFLIPAIMVRSIYN